MLALLISAALLQAQPNAQPKTNAEPPSPLARVIRPYDARHYRIDVRISPDGAFEGTTRIQLVPERVLNSVELDAYLEVTGVEVGGQQAEFTVARDDANETG